MIRINNMDLVALVLIVLAIIFHNKIYDFFIWIATESGL